MSFCTLLVCHLITLSCLPSLDLKFKSDEYSTKQKEGKSPNTVMFQLAWDIRDLSDLIESGRKLKVSCQMLFEQVSLDESEWIVSNLARQLDAL